jgi:hypothetical protein
MITVESTAVYAEDYIEVTVSVVRKVDWGPSRAAFCELFLFVVPRERVGNFPPAREV